jgi:hypothetical protein
MRLAARQLTLEHGRHDRVTVETAGDAAARLAALTRLLPAEDRRLIELLLVRGLSHRAAAMELRVAPGVVSRRIQRLRKLVASPTVRAVAEHVESLAIPARQIAVDHFFSRMSVKLICDRQCLTRREVQAQLDFIRGWARALHRAAMRGRAEARAEASDD